MSRRKVRGQAALGHIYTYMYIYIYICLYIYMYILQVRLGARYGGKLHLYLVILDTRANGNPLIAIAA